VPRSNAASHRPTLLAAALCLGVLLQGCTGAGDGGSSLEPVDPSAAPVGEPAVPAETDTAGTWRSSSDEDIEAACSTLRRITQLDLAMDQADPATAESLNHEIAGLVEELAPRVRASGHGPSDASLADALEEGAALLRDIADRASAERTQGAQLDPNELAEFLRRSGHAQAAIADLALWEHDMCTAGSRVAVGEIAGVPWLHMELGEDLDLDEIPWLMESESDTDADPWPVDPDAEDPDGDRWPEEPDLG
jgi:hypothetical protein